jgi:hypothetical protein
MNDEEVMAAGTQRTCRKFQNTENTMIGFHNTIGVVHTEYIHNTKGPGYHQQPPHLMTMSNSSY